MRRGLGGEWVYVEEGIGQFAIKTANWAVAAHLFNAGPHRLPGYTTYSPARALPRSCIESAEFSMQLQHDPGLRWSGEGEARQPHVVATFGERRTVDVTDAENVQDEVTGMTSYPFAALPKVGEGLIIGNAAKSDAKYNMHLGMVVARHKAKDAAILTDVAEDGPVKLVIPWSVRLVTSVQDFRGEDYEGDNFVVGLLQSSYTDK